MGFKNYILSVFSLNQGGFQKKPRIYDPLYLVHVKQLKLLKKFIREELYNLKDLTLLDLGCGVKPYKDLFIPYVSRYIGSDINGTDADIVCSAEKISLADKSCNIILALQVLEHTNDPPMALKEIHRLLSDNGYAFISIPACFCYHPGIKYYKPGMAIDDLVYPDNWRWTQAGIKKIISDNFMYESVKIESIGGLFQCFGLHLSFLIAELARSFNQYLYYLTMFTIIPLINGSSFILDKIFFKWNRLWAPYTIFLGYAIILKK